MQGRISLRFVFILSLILATQKIYAIDFLKELKLPPHFSIAIYADKLDEPRELALGSNGTVYVGSRSDKVYAIVKNHNDTEVITIASSLNLPNGVAYHNHSLYIAEVHRIIKFENIDNLLKSPPKPVTIITLPNEKHHGLRYIRFGHDNKLYIGIGAPCNACLSKDEQFATIMRMNPDGSDLEIYAKGVRNTVGFDWHPVTHGFYFTDNGRDWMGNDTPPDELNQVLQKRQHFGFPFCHGSNTSDPYYGKFHSCSEFTAPIYEFPAHVAVLGAVFYTGSMFPDIYKNQLLIAEHGSWNRSTKVGYQVISMQVENNRAFNAKPFITGWLRGDSVLGRPVDLLNLPDGSLLISDDFANVVYRVTYSENQ